MRRTIVVDEKVLEITKQRRVSGLIIFTERGEGSCPLACTYCEPAGTRILTGDGRWVGIETLQVGDVLVGFDWRGEGRPRMVPSVVLATATRIAPVYEIETDKGTVQATGDHLWFGDHGRWRRTDRLKPGHFIRWVSRPIDPPDETSEDYRLGYIVGAGLGDGTLGRYSYEYGDAHQFRLAVKDPELLGRYEAYLVALGIPHRRRISHTGSASEAIFVQCRQRVAVMEQTLESWRESEAFYRGFLAGIFDAEGSYDGQNLHISSADETILRRIEHCLQRFDIRFSRQHPRGHVGLITISSTPDAIRFVAATQPAVRRKVQRLFERNLYGRAVVQSVKPVGEMEVYSIQTSSETYIAEGFASHNCFLAKKGPNEVMSVETLHDAIDWLRAVTKHNGRTPRLHFFGTEPTKQWDLIVEARRYAPEMDIGITTNGYLLTEERIRWLDENDVHIYIYSIDGGPQHNKNRITRSGKPSYPIVAKNLQLVLKSKQAEWVTARGTWTPDDYDLVGRYKALEELGAKSIVIVPVVEDERWDEAKVARAYQELADYYQGGPSPNRQIEEMLRQLEKGVDHPPGNGCGTGFFAWAVSPSGKLSLCQAYEEHDYGTIGSIYEGITNPAAFEISDTVDRFHTEHDPYPKPGCRTCHAYNFCMGTGFCGEINQEATGKPNVPPDGYCAHLRGMVTGLKYWLSLRHRNLVRQLLLGMAISNGDNASATDPAEPARAADQGNTTLIC